MVKTVKRRKTEKASKKNRSNKKRHSNKKKSMKIKRVFLRKNNKRTKRSKSNVAHKRNIKHHYHRGHHNTHRVHCGGRKKMKKMKNTKRFRGGMVSSPAAGPVGYSWEGGNESTWPGVGAGHGINTQGTTVSNHFSLSPNGVVVGGIEQARSTSDDVNINSSMMGGKARKGKKGRKGKYGNNMKGGGLFQEIINLGRVTQYGLNGGYYNLSGKTQPLSQNPYPTDQLINKTVSFIGGTPPDVKGIYVDANMNAASV